MLSLRNRTVARQPYVPRTRPGRVTASHSIVPDVLSMDGVVVPSNAAWRPYLMNSPAYSPSSPIAEFPSLPAELQLTPLVETVIEDPVAHETPPPSPQTPRPAPERPATPPVPTPVHTPEPTVRSTEPPAAPTRLTVPSSSVYYGSLEGVSKKLNFPGPSVKIMDFGAVKTPEFKLKKRMRAVFTPTPSPSTTTTTTTTILKKVKKTHSASSPSSSHSVHWNTPAPPATLSRTVQPGDSSTDDEDEEVESLLKSAVWNPPKVVPLPFSDPNASLDEKHPKALKALLPTQSLTAALSLTPLVVPLGPLTVGTVQKPTPITGTVNRSLFVPSTWVSLFVPNCSRPFIAASVRQRLLDVEASAWNAYVAARNQPIGMGITKRLEWEHSVKGLHVSSSQEFWDHYNARLRSLV